MAIFIFKRVIGIPVTLFILSLMIFSLVLFLSPSERVAVFVSSSDALQSASLEELIERYGLDQPFYVQYGNWVKELLRGNLGWSSSARMPISEALALRIPATIELLFAGQVILLFGGIYLGTLAAEKENRFTDHCIRLLTIVGGAIPEFLVGLFLLILFYVTFDLLPPGRLGMLSTDIVNAPAFVKYTGLHLVDSLLNGQPHVFMDAFSHLILPSMAYSLGGLAATVRLMRSSLLDNLSRGYVPTARLKGLSNRQVMTRHVRRNAMLPVITFMGMRIPVLLSGSVIVETIFNFPGMGMFIVTAAQGLDFPAIIAASLAVSVIIIISNLIVDILYTVLNPQIRLDISR
ncbi:MAG: ABC transporter permease [Desulfobacterium sp.]|nr:ABC transporter permease [Desulfobacterium sp.]